MRFFKRFSLCFFAIIVFSMSTVSQFKAMLGTENTEINSVETKSEFSDRRVIVVLDRESSLDFKTYCVDDFPEVDCVDITNLTPETEKKAEESVKKGNTDVSYNKILCLELKYPGKDNVIDAIAKLKEKEHILCAEPDYVIALCDTTPDDTHYDKQWGHEKIDLPSAWDEETGSSSVYVGVLDTGIEGTHPEFSGRIKTEWCMSFLTGTGVAETSPTDPRGHGTHVAGIIGAAGNNNLGVCGVCWNVKLVSLKVIGSNGSGNISYAALAVDYAESKSIPILNLSIRWFNYSSSLETAINNYSGLAVCAAGNDGKDIDTDPVYPACYTCSNIITVGKSDSDDNKVDNSNYGESSVDIFAPGQGILSTFPLSICNLGNCKPSKHCSDGYHFKNGTSMAAPYVAGVAALIKSCHPNITTTQLKNAILNNGDSCSSLSGYCVTGCRLNAYNALHSIHSFTSYVDYGNAYYHKKACSICGLHGTTLSLHIWIPNTLHTKYTCNKCGATTTDPSLPREE